MHKHIVFIVIVCGSSYLALCIINVFLELLNINN